MQRITRQRGTVARHALALSLCTAAAGQPAPEDSGSLIGGPVSVQPVDIAELAPPEIDPATPAPASESQDSGVGSGTSASSHVPAHEHLPLGQPRAGLGLKNESGSGSTDARSGAVTTWMDGGGSLAQVVGALAFVLMLMWVAARVMRRFAGPLAGGRRPSGVIDVLARFPVARGQQLVLLRLGRRILLVHQSGGAMTTLSELTDETEVAAMLARIEAGSRDGMAGRFQSVLDQFNAEHSASTTGPGRTASASISPARQGEVIDLTRRGRRGAAGFGRWLERLRGTGASSR